MIIRTSELVELHAARIKALLQQKIKEIAEDGSNTNQGQVVLKKRLIDAISGEPELRTKQALIEEFIENNLPLIGDAAEIPDSFEEFWEQKRQQAFESLVKEEQLDADKLAKVIERYIYTGVEPLPDPDIIDLLTVKPKLSERKPTRERVLHRVIDYVETFIREAA